MTTNSNETLILKLKVHKTATNNFDYFNDHNLENFKVDKKLEIQVRNEFSFFSIK